MASVVKDCLVKWTVFEKIEPEQLEVRSSAFVVTEKKKKKNYISEKVVYISEEEA